MVDSTPTAHAPPSRISGILSPSPCATCSAVVGLTVPEMLALGAATGRPNAASIFRASGWTGKRTPTVSSPALTKCEIGLSDVFFITIVSGPGQNFSASFFAAGDISANRSTQETSAMWAIRGLNCGRPFVSKIDATAISFAASAPNPYTVSVGKATSRPRSSRRAAKARLCGVTFSTDIV